MLGMFQLFYQNANFGVEVGTYHGDAFVRLEYTSKAQYYLPEGI